MRRATLLERAVAVAGMVAVWLLLWGNAGPWTIAGGVIVAVLALMVFPLPLVPFGGRISQVGVLLFLACFLRDLVLASVQVAWLAVRPGPAPVSAIVAVPLRARSDLHITLTAAAVSLIPGSLIVEADRSGAILYIHVIGVSTHADVDAARAAIRALEARILHATGIPPTPAATTGSAPGESVAGSVPADPLVGTAPGAAVAGSVSGGPVVGTAPGAAVAGSVSGGPVVGSAPGAPGTGSGPGESSAGPVSREIAAAPVTGESVAGIASGVAAGATVTAARTNQEAARSADREGRKRRGNDRGVAGAVRVDTTVRTGEEDRA